MNIPENPAPARRPDPAGAGARKIMDFKISDVQYDQVQHAPLDGKGASLQGGIAAATFTCTCGFKAGRIRID